jgi:formate hydrogenlyase subunit 3/multisubunit Na+/H+ antiporter MnhD subunit
MNSALLLMIWLLPLLLATLARQRHARWLVPLAALPGLLAVAVLPVGTTVSLPWLLLGSELGIDETGRVFLGFSSLLWLLAAVYIAGSRETIADSGRFRTFFLLAMAGNFALIVAQDMVSFYFGFALMGLSAYGLIAHTSSRRARRAARTYLAWTIAGELLLFTAMVMLAASGAGALTFDALQSIPRSPLTVMLLIAGFGIKLALPLLHWWLPPAYAVTPVAAVALFSGVMIKAGLLGWLRFLPPGDATPAAWGTVLILIGAATVVFGVIAGLLQRRPRLLLGYSSISKMGVLTIGLGATLAFPLSAPGIVAALLVYATHHALVKTALFLGLGLVERGGLRLSLLIGVGFLALVLAGAPLTSGALAKSALSDSLSQSAPALLTLLAVSTLATTLLMVRFMFLLWSRRRREVMPLPWLPGSVWLCLVAVIAVLPFLLAGADGLMINVIPVVLGLVLGPLVNVMGVHLSSYFTGGRQRDRIQAWRFRMRAAFGHVSQIAQFSSGLRDTVRVRAVTAYQRKLAAWLACLQRRTDTARRPLTAALWLGIGGWLLNALVTTI